MNVDRIKKRILISLIVAVEGTLLNLLGTSTNIYLIELIGLLLIYASISIMVYVAWNDNGKKRSRQNRPDFVKKYVPHPKRTGKINFRDSGVKEK